MILGLGSFEFRDLGLGSFEFRDLGFFGGLGGEAEVLRPEFGLRGGVGFVADQGLSAAPAGICFRVRGSQVLGFRISGLGGVGFRRFRLVGCSGHRVIEGVPYELICGG